MGELSREWARRGKGGPGGVMPGGRKARGRMGQAVDEPPSSAASKSGGRRSVRATRVRKGWRSVLITERTGGELVIHLEPQRNNCDRYLLIVNGHRLVC